MKKLCLVFTVVLATMLLTACGNLSQQDVVDKLAGNLDDANSYLTTGNMEIESEGQMYQYFVEVAFQQPHYYRVTMRNETTNNEQIILKNDEGVFVLTPSLNKQFKFQSDWPLSSSQVYLYQSVLADILNDEAAVFTPGDEAYTFETIANYHGNRDLLKQVITFDKKSLAPINVQVLDSGDTVRMSMNFDKFEFNHEFEEGHFDSNLAMEQTQNTMGDGTLSEIDLLAAELYPSYIPDGTALTDKTPIETENGNRIIMTFSGEQIFTIIQENATVRESLTPELVSGDIVLINGAVGALSENSLTWVDNGVEFFVVSDTLDPEELLTVANSIGSVIEKGSETSLKIN